jgi:NTE family protein
MYDDALELEAHDTKNQYTFKTASCPIIIHLHDPEWSCAFPDHITQTQDAVPAVFEPVRIGGKEYVDGGLVSPVPVRYARQMGADIVLAVDISSAPEGNKSDDMLKILLQTFTIMSKSINSFELPQADLVVKPALLGVSSVEFANRQQSIDAGRAAMKLALPKLKALLNN